MVSLFESEKSGKIGLILERVLIQSMEKYMPMKTITPEWWSCKGLSYK